MLNNDNVRQTIRGRCNKATMSFQQSRLNNDRKIKVLSHTNIIVDFSFSFDLFMTPVAIKSTYMKL